jgi:hypothetical protein
MATKARPPGRTLTGSWVLVRMRGERQWLLIKRRDAAVSNEDFTVTRPLSVVSRRTMGGIARAAGASPRQLELASADPAHPAADVPTRPTAKSMRPPS